MRFREVDSMLRKDGWYEVRKVGSHHQYKHPTKPGTVTVPEQASKDIQPETVKSIKRYAGI